MKSITGLIEILGQEKTRAYIENGNEVRLMNYIMTIINMRKGDILEHIGKWNKTEVVYKRCIQLFKKGKGQALGNIGLVYKDIGSYEKAME